jgi:hypothetical protein
MTYSPMQNVTEFHDKFHRDGKGRHERPISVSTIDRRIKLIREEYEETMLELNDMRYFINNSSPYEIPYQKVLLAKELADLIYVIYGTAEELQIPLEEVFKAVHQNNMQKIWPDGEVHYNEFGKILKPPGFVPLDVSALFK